MQTGKLSETKNIIEILNRIDFFLFSLQNFFN